MSGKQAPGERITLTRSAIRELCREARAHGYAWGRRDEHAAQWVARLAGTRVPEPVDQVAFVGQAMARREDVLSRLWRDMQAQQEIQGS